MSSLLLTLMIYDVSDDKRRTRLHKYLKQYGRPVQESAFEGRLTVTERKRVMDRAGQLIDPSTDRFLMYTIPADHERRIEAIGVPRPPMPAEGWFVV